MKTAALILCCGAAVICAAAPGAYSAARQRASKNFVEARTRFQSNTNDTEAAVQFVRTAFDWGEFAQSNKQRAETAEQAIPVCKRLVEREPKLAAAHYYLAMNLGQLARTKSLGALRLVDEMERAFHNARGLDEHLDFAGPDRNLGQLYLEAPAFSVGDKTKARRHLERAAELEPVFPENNLLVAEAFLRWGDKKSAQKFLDAVEKIWPEAKQKFTGEEWEISWLDWEARLKKLRARLPVSAAPKK